MEKNRAQIIEDYFSSEHSDARSMDDGIGGAISHPSKQEQTILPLVPQERPLIANGGAIEGVVIYSLGSSIQAEHETLGAERMESECGKLGMISRSRLESLSLQSEIREL